MRLSVENNEPGRLSSYVPFIIPCNITSFMLFNIEGSLMSNLPAKRLFRLGNP